VKRGKYQDYNRGEQGETGEKTGVNTGWEQEIKTGMK
jgi:hypothetical protein